MRISRPVAVTVFSATALAGGLAGALLLGPVGAEPSSDLAAVQPTSSAETGAATARCGRGFAAVADAIGVSTRELRDALRDGQTLAEIAEAHGTDPQAVVDVLVANGTDRLDAAVDAGRIDRPAADALEASLPERAEQLVNGELERDVRRHHPGRWVALRTAAEAIGVSTHDLGEALHGGQTIAQVAEAHEVDPQDVIDALAIKATERITKVVNGDTARQRC